MGNIHRYVAALAAGALIAMLGIADNVARASNFQTPARGYVTLPLRTKGTPAQLVKSVEVANQRDPGCSG